MNPSEEELQKEAREADMYYQLACSKFNQEKYQEAADLFTKSIDVCKYVVNASAYINRGTARMALGQYQKAIDDFNSPFVELHDRDGSTSNSDLIIKYTNLGFCYFNLGNMTEAKKYYQKVLSINPDDMDAQMMLLSMSID